MLIAKIVDGSIVVGRSSDLFPNVSFSEKGPNDSFLLENDCYRVVTSLPYDVDSEVLVNVEPYIENGLVYTVVKQPLGPERLIQSIVDKTQERLDSFARTKNYDGILSACTYSTSSIPTFRSEAERAVQLRDLTWMTLYSLLAEVQSGNRVPPTKYSDIENLLPELTWE